MGPSPNQIKEKLQSSTKNALKRRLHPTPTPPWPCTKNASDLSSARMFFDSMKHKNVVTWNLIISGYAYNGFLDEAHDLLKRTEDEGFEPNLTTWNGLISDAPYFFTELQKEQIEPNSATLATVLRACGSPAVLNKGLQIHRSATRKGLDKGIYVATALIHMQSKLGNLQDAHWVLKNMTDKNLTLWNAMIMAFATYGQAKESSLLSDEMCQLGIEPDGITFRALLSSCRHSGLISEGWKYFEETTSRYGLTPRLEHYTSIVDPLARGGYLGEAFDFIQDMRLWPDASLWGALLGACRIHKNLELAEIAAKQLFKLEPHNSANYPLMMSLSTYEKRWEDVENLRIVMNAANLKSKAGWSWIQIGESVHVFSVEGK